MDYLPRMRKCLTLHSTQSDPTPDTAPFPFHSPEIVVVQTIPFGILPRKAQADIDPAVGCNRWLVVPKRVAEEIPFPLLGVAHGIRGNAWRTG